MNRNEFEFIRKPLFHQSMATLCSMMLCIFACSLVLLNAAGDQSGAMLSSITQSFQFSVKSKGRDLIEASASAIDSHNSDTRELRKSTVHTASTSQKSGRLSSASLSGFVESDQLIDAHGAAFSSLLSEFMRYCQVSSVVGYDGEVAIDLLSATSTKDEQIVQFVEEAIQRIEQESQSTLWQFELICWATTPQKTSLSDAILKAARIQAAIKTRFSTDVRSQLEIASSGRIWLSESNIRPAATLVIRRATELSAN